jgi:hypothetical protein
VLTYRLEQQFEGLIKELTKPLINSMERNPYWGGNSRSATQEIVRLLCHLKDRHFVHTSPLGRIVEQINPVHALLHFL